MKRILAVICLAALVISLFAAAETESVGVSSDMRTYAAGKYIVGKNADPGEYILFSAPYQTGFFAIYSDLGGVDLISKGSFDTNTIVAVEEGDCLIVANSIAIYAKDYYRVGTIRLRPSGGTLRVGTDVPSGEQEVKGQAGKTSVYRIYNDMRYRLVAEEGEVDGARQIFLDENQYVELINCTIDIDYPEPTPRPTPTPGPDGAPVPVSTRRPSAKKTPKPSESSRQTAAPVQDTRANKRATETPLPTATPTPSPTPTPKVIRKVRIDQKRSPTVRSMPSTMGEKVGVAKAGAEYELLQVGRKWLKIRLDNGVEGWITDSMAEIIR